MTDWAQTYSLGMLIISRHVLLWWLYVAHARKASISKRCYWQDMGIHSLEYRQRLVHPGPWARHIESQTHRQESFFIIQSHQTLKSFPNIFQIKLQASDTKKPLIEFLTLTEFDQLNKALFWSIKYQGHKFRILDYKDMFVWCVNVSVHKNIPFSIEINIDTLRKSGRSGLLLGRAH